MWSVSAYVYHAITTSHYQPPKPTKQQEVPDLQITLRSEQVSRPLRQLAAGNVGRLIKVRIDGWMDVYI